MFTKRPHFYKSKGMTDREVAFNGKQQDSQNRHGAETSLLYFFNDLSNDLINARTDCWPSELPYKRFQIHMRPNMDPHLIRPIFLATCWFIRRDGQKFNKTVV